MQEPYPKQIDFFEATTRYIAYGGARGGGKSWSVRSKAVLLALNYSGIQILLLRRTFPELRSNHIIPLCTLLRTEDKKNKIAQYKEQQKEFLFPNGSRIVLGYCANEKDVLQYQGQSYDVIFMEEATQFTEFQFQALTECNRSSGLCKTKFRPRMYFTCNPGGVGHAWVKRLFIDKQYKNSEIPQDYTFIQSLVYENEFLIKNSPDYIRTLENLPEDRRKAMLYGDWDIFEGQYFKEFDRSIHVIESFIIPKHWKRYIAMDYGLDMCAVLWIARDTEGKAYVYKELSLPNLIISEAVSKIIEINNNDEYEYIYAPRDLWNRRQETGKSVADIFSENGLYLTQTSVERIDGWLSVKEWLKVKENRNVENGNIEKTADLKIFSNCVELIRCLPQLQHSEKDPNDVSTEPHEFTHITDALRYFCVNYTYESNNPEVNKNAYIPFALKTDEKIKGDLIEW